MQPRKHFTASQKAQTALEILKEEKAVNQIASEYGVHPNVLYRWKKQALENLPKLFEDENKGERERLSQPLHRREISKIILWFPLIFIGLFFAIQLSPIATIAILGFWIAWEFNWWGGADAVSAITICLIWPGIFFIMSFLVIHLIVVIALGLVSMVREQKIMLHRLPGLPILLASVIFLKIILVFLT